MICIYDAVRLRYDLVYTVIDSDNNLSFDTGFIEYHMSSQ